MIRHTIGGWELGVIATVRTGERLVITQNCASDWILGATTRARDHSP